MSRRGVCPHRGGGLFRGRHLALSVALGLTLASTAVARPAGASPQGDLASKTAQAQRLEAQIAANAERADVLDEQYLQARHAVSQANAEILVAEQGLASAREQESQLRTRLGGRAARLYMGAGSGDPLGMDATSVQELGARAKYGEAAAESDNRMIDQLTVLDEQLHRQTQELEKQKAAAQKQQDEADAARHEVEKISGQMEQLLRSTRSDIVTLANKIQRQRLAAEAAAVQARLRAQAEQAARQAAAAQAAAARAAADNGGVGVVPSTGDTGVDLGNIPAPSGGAAAAVAYARAQLGKPYVYAGTGPGSFDCSGLTMMAWLQGGVSMTHGSQAQYASFPKVPISELQPGDLVFFGSSGPSNHHVGIVVAPGVMIDAPHSGSYVQQVSYYRRDLVSLGSRP
jgi:peptidoglycan DL-endopeptidase CwlO